MFSKLALLQSCCQHCFSLTQLRSISYFLMLMHLYGRSCCVFNISCATVNLSIVFQLGCPFSTADLHLLVSYVTIPSYGGTGVLSVLFTCCGVNVHFSSSQNKNTWRIKELCYIKYFQCFTLQSLRLQQFEFLTTAFNGKFIPTF